jgi:peptidoglycan hydrolase CwlO-like protein
MVMEQYKSEGTIDGSAIKPTTISAETRQIQSVESTIKQLQETVNLQHQEIMKLHRDITRLKNDISDIVTTLRGRG